MVGIEEFGYLFYRPEIAAALEANPDIDVWSFGDPFVRRWTDVQPKTMIDELDSRLYELYDRSSWWVHGNVRGLARGVTFSGSDFTYGSNDIVMVHGALAMACQSLHQTLRIYLDHFGILQVDALDEFEMMRWEYSLANGFDVTDEESTDK